MKKGKILEGRVIRLDFPNKGIVQAVDENGEKHICVVKNVLPGQKVSFMAQKKKAGKTEGRLLEVLEKAENEVKSDCPHDGACGGCCYRNLTYEDQCELKENQVKSLLEQVLCKQEREWTFEKIRKSPVQYGYRNKMEFSFGDEVKDGPLSLGMHKRGSFYDIVTVSDCQIVDEDYRKILTATRDYFEKAGLPFFHRLRHTGYLRHLLVRKAAKTGEILVALVTTGAVDSVVKKSEESGDGSGAPVKAGSYEEVLLSYVNLLRGLTLDGKIVGVLHTRNDSVADVVKSDETRLLYGQDYFYEELLGLKFKITQFSFFQTNSLGAELLYQTAREYIGGLGKEKVVFDLYSGTGTIAQLMAPAVKKVVGVEIVEEAVEAARKNAELNGLHNCEFIAGDVLKVLDEIKEKPDFIILDPPRDGVHPKALKKILNYGVERMVYISCKPTSLTRDLKLFLEAGYQVERACCVDMFPWTGNVEVVCLLSKKP